MALTKETRLNHTLRVSLEQSPDPVSAQVLNRLRAIEGKAKQMREQGSSENEINRELRSELDDLKAAAGRSYAETAKEYRRAVEERVSELVEQREKKPELRNMRFMEAQNRIAALTGEEASSLAQQYMSEQADLSLEELNELSRRLDAAGDSQQHRALREVMGQRRAHAWWLEDEEAAAYDETAARLERGAQGKIPVQTEEGIMDTPFEYLVDLGGELDEEVN